MAMDTDRNLGHYLRDEVAAHSPYHRERLEPILPSGAVGGDDLGRVPLVALHDVTDPAALVLRPDWNSLAAGGRRRRLDRAAVEHRYKPVHWVIQAGLPIGSSAADLARLAGIGARGLDLAGVRGTDVLVGIAPPGPNLPYWQLVLGARELGLSAIHLPPGPAPAQVARFRPTVLAGRPFDLARLLEAARDEGRSLAGVRTVLALGETLEAGLRARLRRLLEADDVAVVAAWAPPGVRALWSECRSGAGLHTWPDAEVIQIVDPLSDELARPGADGEVAWTALGWMGSVFVRLRTGVFASFEDGPCPGCGRTSPRLAVAPGTPAFLGALDEHEGVAGWQAELRRVDGDEELVVFLVPGPTVRLGELLADLDAELSATQYVVVDEGALDDRIAAHGDRRVVDHRS